MLEKQKTIKFSPHLELYDKLIPQGHFLRRFADEVDFSFIYGELVSKYSENMGRQAIDPIQMLKYLILKILSNLSDVDLMEEVQFNLAYKYFLGLSPEDMPIDPTSLCKFRTQRLKDVELLDKLLGKTIDMAIDRGIIEQDHTTGKAKINLIIDGTHTESYARMYRPIPGLKEWSKKLRAQLYRLDETYVGKIKNDHSISDLTQEIEYCTNLVCFAKEYFQKYLSVQSFKRVLNKLDELITDITNHYSISEDNDAREGHKTADTSFFGYKGQIIIDEKSRLIVDAETSSGEVGDAIPGKVVLERLANNDKIEIDEVLGDTAYSGQPILELAKEKQFLLIAPPHPQLGLNIDGRDGFTFNKDADMFCCPQGHLAIRKRLVQYNKDNNRKAIIYSFDPQKCSVCKLREQCIKGSAKFRTFSVTALTDEQKQHLENSKTDYFKERIRQRYKIEAKNAHLKQGLGFDRTMGKGLHAMELQAAVTFFVSNMKLILSKS